MNQQHAQKHGVSLGVIQACARPSACLFLCFRQNPRGSLLWFAVIVQLPHCDAGRAEIPQFYLVGSCSTLRPCYGRVDSRSRELRGWSVAFEQQQAPSLRAWSKWRMHTDLSAV